MAYTKQSRKRGVGLSLDEVTIRRIDALGDGAETRSEFLREIVTAGLEQRFGADWQEIADRKLVTTDTDFRCA